MNARAAVLGHTPLHLAAQFNNNPAVIEVLLDAGADATARDLSDNTPWDYAKDRRELQGSDAYQRLSEVQELAADLESPSLCAEWSTQEFFESATLEIVESCLAAGIDVNAQGVFGYTPLYFAVQYSDNSAIIKALLAAGAEVNVRNMLNDTPLDLAAEVNDNPTVIKALVGAGAEVNARNRFGWTPLHVAAQFNDNPAVITALLEAEADVAAQDHLDRTPLHIAAGWNDNPAIIEALLDAGAPTIARDREGKTPWDLAQGNEALEGTDAYRRLSEAQELAQECAGWNTWEFFGSTTLEEVRGCLEAGAKANARDEDGDTPLHYAVQWSGSAVAAALIDAGAEVNARGSLGETPLHTAALHNPSPAFVKILVEAGAEVDARGEYGWTPLHWAVRYNSDYPAFAAALVNAGADVTARDADVTARDGDGNTPLHHVPSSFDPEAGQWL